ncbi:MAG: hypothetical protein DI630_18955 [Gordonia sp. (in: high G+C Gram-positive bacteria)]|nr:MAG: hypothetical protein DI630_18955 [Gordonia sp. (in: high G+C Gram-positive bacteria)]
MSGALVAEFDRAYRDAVIPSAIATSTSLASQFAGRELAQLLAAACAWEVLTTSTSSQDSGIALLEHVVDHYGTDFAAECVIVAASVSARGEAPGQIRARAWQDLRGFHLTEVHSHLRTLLAGLADAEYTAVVDRAARLRGLTLAGNLESSFLLPTQNDWVDSDIEAFSSVEVDDKWSVIWLLTCVTTVETAEHIFETASRIDPREPSRGTAVWAVGQHPHLVYSMCTNVGPGCEYLVGELFDGNLYAKHKKIMAKILAEFDTDAALTELLSRIDDKYVEPAILDAMTRNPERAARMLAVASGPTAVRLLSDLQRTHPKMSSKAAATVPSALSVPAEDLPALLVSPPWQQPRSRRSPLVLNVPAPERELAVSWLPGEHNDWLHRYHADDTGHYYSSGSQAHLETVANAPDEIARRLLREGIPTFLWRAEPTLQRILARFGDPAADFVLRVARSRPALTPVLAPIDGTAVSAHMIERLGNKSIRPTAMHWFRRHIDTAAADLVAHTLGATGSPRRRAEQLLGQLGREGHRDHLLDASRALAGDDAHAEVTRILDTDPLMHLPSRVPTMPEWLSPVLLPPISLKGDDRPLPASAVTNICTMLAMSRLGDEYAGIDILRHLISSAHLAQFTRDIFTRWSAAGFPLQQDWALDALGVLGDNITVDLLAPLIQTWPLQSAHRRATTGLDVLMAIGSDNALHALWTIADGLRFPALRKKAEANINYIADQLDLAPEDLADRVIPRLGFDAQSTMIIDYHRTTFMVSLTNRLLVQITDSTGTPLADVPAPNAADPGDVHDTYKRYTTMRRTLRTTGPDLIGRLQTAMLTERQWTLDAVVQRYLHHPLMGPLARNLLWVNDQGAFFRFDELTKEPVTASEQPLHLDGAATIRLAHPVAMASDDLRAWQTVFDNSALEQPFEQLWRAVYTNELTEGLSLYENVKVSTRELLALRRSGWVREEPQDKGAQIALHKPIGKGALATMMVFPGFNISNAQQWKTQRIVDVSVSGSQQLSPIDTSELMRDLSALKTRPIKATDTNLIDRSLGFDADT